MDTYAGVVEAIQKRIRSSTSFTLRNFEFWSSALAQRRGEQFDRFIARVVKAAMRCNFVETTSGMTVSERLIRSRLLIGLEDRDLQREMLAADVTLGVLLLKCRARETAKRGAVLLLGDRRTSKGSNSGAGEAEGAYAATPQLNPVGKGEFLGKQHPAGARSQRRACPNCGVLHEAARCRAKGCVCAKCGALEHFERCYVQSMARIDPRRGLQQRNQQFESWSDRRHMSALQAAGDKSEDEASSDEHRVNAITVATPTTENSHKSIARLNKTGGIWQKKPMGRNIIH